MMAPNRRDDSYDVFVFVFFFVLTIFILASR